MNEINFDIKNLSIEMLNKIKDRFKGLWNNFTTWAEETGNMPDFRRGVLPGKVSLNPENKTSEFKEGGEMENDEYYGGELLPAVITPEPIRIVLTTDGFSKTTPITHSSLHAPGLWISKGSDDPTYNLFTANCSDATGEILSSIANRNLTKGITTPYGLARKVRGIFKNYPGYYEDFYGINAHQTFEVPWYDYRVAKDLNTKQRINSFVAGAKKRNVSKNKIDDVVQHILENSPLLSYKLIDGRVIKND